MTKNRVLYAVTLLFTAFFVLMVQETIAFVLLYAVLLLPVLSFALILLSRFLLKVTQSLDSNLVIKGGQTQYLLTLHNRSFLRLHSVKIWFGHPKFGVECNMEEQMVSVSPLEEKKILFEIKCHCRGVYELSVDVIELNDFLGLFKMRREVNTKEQLLVYPRVNEFFKLPPALNLQVKADSSRGSTLEDLTDIADMRQYRPSDSLRKVHWKLSAKRQELIVKNYQMPATAAVAVFLDQNLLRPQLNDLTERQRVLLEDKMVETCVSVIHALLKNDRPVEFLYGQTEHRKERAHDITVFEVIYDIIANLKCDGKQEPAKWLEDYIYQQNESLNIILLVAGIQKEFLETLLLAQKLGHNTITYYFSPESRVDEKMLEAFQKHALAYEGVWLSHE